MQTHRNTHRALHRQKDRHAHMMKSPPEPEDILPVPAEWDMLGWAPWAESLDLQRTLTKCSTTHTHTQVLVYVYTAAVGVYMCACVSPCHSAAILNICVLAACVYAHVRKSVAGGRLGRVSTAGGLWLLRSDYIGATGGVSRLVALSVFCVADWTDTQRMEMAQPGTLGLPPRDLAGIEPHNGFTQENAPISYLTCRFHICHLIWL